MAKWKVQLDSRTENWKKCKSWCPRTKIWRIQIQEVEVPHQQKISDLEAGAKLPTDVFNVRRELERSKTEFAAYTEHQEAARASDRDA